MLFGKEGRKGIFQGENVTVEKPENFLCAGRLQIT
jgi:hypothetical protein